MGRALQERDRGKWDRGADDGGVHRSESRAGRDGFRSGGVSMEQLRGSGGWRAEGEREKGARGTGPCVHESLRRGFRGGAVEGGFADLPSDDGAGAGEEERQCVGEERRGSSANEYGGGVRGGGQRDGFAGLGVGGDVALPGEILHGRRGDWEQSIRE